MKNQNIVLSALILFTSCAPTKFFQLCTTNSENGVLGNEQIVFEDANCKILYNFWADGGVMDAFVFNKAEDDLVIDLSKSFLVINNLSRTYFPDLVYLNNGSNCCQGKSEMRIPSKTMVFMPEFKLRASRFILCDISDHPNQKNGQSLKFEKLTSPFTFNHIVTYSTKGEVIRMENQFYVSEIVNMPYSSSYKNVYIDQCGRTLANRATRKVYNFYSPDKFFFEYTY